MFVVVIVSCSGAVNILIIIIYFLNWGQYLLMIYILVYIFRLKKIMILLK